MARLDGIQVFTRVAEAGSFIAAARGLGLTASAVGKSIARLETDLGVRLIQRTTRRLTLTEEGRLLHERCRRALEDIADVQAQLRESAHTPAGQLRVGLPTIGYRFLLPSLPTFRSCYPAVTLDLDFNDRLVDPVAEGLDLVIRSGALVDSSLMSRRLGPFRFQVCGAPDYLARKGRPDSPDALKAHDCLRFVYPTSGRSQPWDFANGQRHWPEAGGTAIACNNMEALREAAILGLGLARMPDFLARDAIADGRLRPVLSDYEGEAGVFTALWPSNRHLSPKVRVFVEHLTRSLFPPSPE